MERSQALDMTRTRPDSFSETLILRVRSRRLGRALAVLVLCGLAALLLQSAWARDAVVAPDFALPASTGHNLRLSEYRSEVVALAFHAAWCGPCREGLAGLARLQEAHAADGLRVLVVSFDPPAQAAGAVPASLPVLADPAGEVGRLYDVDDLPLVVLVDRAGVVRGRYTEAAASAIESLQQEIGRLLAE
jgi:peroxiredoxin